MEKLPILNLPIYKHKIKSLNKNLQIFDVVRKKYVRLSNEEWVRQNFIHFLNKENNYPLGLMNVEKLVKYNSLRTRADILLYDRYGKADMIVECKSSDIKINLEAIFQIAKYNYNLKVNFLVVTNGMEHFAFEMDYKNSKINRLKSIPIYKSSP